MNSEQYQPTLDSTQLMGELRRLLVAQRRADRLICRYLADLADGMDSCPAFVLVYQDVCELVHARLKLSFRAIRERIRVGKALRTLPLLDAALMAGDLTYSQVRELTRVAQPDDERLWFEAARHLSMRALEQRVAKASRAPRSRPHVPSGTIESAPDAPTPQVPPSRLLDVPGDVLALLQQAMQSARAKSERVLTDAEALAEVARAAMAHFAKQPSADGSHQSATHSESRASETSEGATVDRPGLKEVDSSGSGSPEHSSGSPLPGEVQAGPSGVPPATHSGSTAATPNPGAPLSEDAQLLLTVIRSRDCWYPDTLQEITALPGPRFTAALFDLLCRHLVTRGPSGLFEAAKAGFKRAG